MTLEHFFQRSREANAKINPTASMGIGSIAGSIGLAYASEIIDLRSSMDFLPSIGNQRVIGSIALLAIGFAGILSSLASTEQRRRNHRQNTKA